MWDGPLVILAMIVIAALLCASPTGKLHASGLYDIRLKPGEKPWM
jgi:hypothetical protein